MVRNDATARRLRLLDGCLRTTVGLDTLLTQRVDSVSLAGVKRVDVLAPYSPSTPKLALIIFGLSLGMMIGSQFQPGAAIVIAVMTVTFAVVAHLVGGMTPASQRLARLEMDGGDPYMISYRVEDEDEVVALFGSARWNSANATTMTEPLSSDERMHADRMRFGLLLAAGALALIALALAITTDSGVSDAVAIPVNILYLAVLGLTLIFSGLSWYKLTRVGIRRHDAP